MELKAVIFDIDGVIVDTENIHRLAYNEIFAEENIPLQWSPKEYAARLHMVGGKKLKEVVEYVDTPDKEAEAKRLYSLKIRRYKDLVTRMCESGELVPREGVTELIDEMIEAQFPFGAASSCEKPGALALLGGSLGEERLSAFKTVCAGDDVTKRKPAPDIYLMALEKMGIGPEGVVAIEDSAHGAEAARDAGLLCIVTPSEYTDGSDFSAANLVLESLVIGNGKSENLGYIRQFVRNQ